MTYNYDPSTGPDLFTTHSDPCKKKPVWYQLFPLNDCLFRVNKCRDPRLRCFFWGKARGWYHCRTTWGQCSFYHTARWTSTCRHCNLQGSSKYQMVRVNFKKKKKRPDLKKTMSFWKARNFQLFNDHRGNFYRVPVVNIISGVKKQVFSTVLEFFLGPTRWAPTSCRWGEIAPISRVFSPEWKPIVRPFTGVLSHHL